MATKDNNTPELKDCPFCGGFENLVVENDNSGSTYCYVVFCDDCSAIGPCDDNKDDAIKEWNRRA